MSDEEEIRTPKLKLLQFQSEPAPDFVKVRPPPGSGRYGIFPLQEDVIVSLDVFNVILWELERGTAETRARLAGTLRTTYGAPFQPKG